MKIIVLNGSPKGETSVTMQYVHYIQKAFPQHELEIVHIAQRLKKIERDPGLFEEILNRVRAADGVLWAFPLYFMLVHAHYKRYVAFVVSGPLSQLPNLREIMEAYVQFQQANLVGFVSDEYGDSAAIDALLEGLAERLVENAGRGYIQPRNFLGVGGQKVFRDDVWGRLRAIFQADHRAYRRLGFYDFPPSNLRIRVQSTFLALLLRVGPVRRVFTPRIREGMIAPYQKMLRST
jgi:hypothetical protein